MTTTTISKFPIQSPLNSHNTQAPPCDFYIDLVGLGADTFAGEISKKHAHRFKDRDQAELREFVQVFDPDGTPQGLISEIPVWALQGDYSFYQGIDVSRAFAMTVQDATGDVLFDNKKGRQWMAELVEKHGIEVNSVEFIGTAPYLYAKDIFPMHVRYSVTSDKPFDPKLIALKCEDVHRTRFIDRFEYDGQEILPEFMFWPYADTEHRIVKIQLH